MFYPVSRTTTIVFEDEDTGKSYKVESWCGDVTVFEESRTSSSDGYIDLQWVPCKDQEKVGNLTFAFKNETK